MHSIQEYQSLLNQQHGLTSHSEWETLKGLIEWSESGRIGNHFMGWPVCLSRELESKDSRPFDKQKLAANSQAENQKASYSVPRLALTHCLVRHALLSRLSSIPWWLGFQVSAPPLPQSSTSCQFQTRHRYCSHSFAMQYALTQASSMHLLRRASEDPMSSSTPVHSHVKRVHHLRPSTWVCRPRPRFTGLFSTRSVKISHE